MWDTAYIIQMLSSVFLSLNFLRIVWTLLSTWVSFPGVKVCGKWRVGELCVGWCVERGAYLFSLSFFSFPPYS